MVQFTNFIYSIVNTVAPFMTGTVAIYIVAFSLVVFIYDIFFLGMVLFLNGFATL